jgi:hypothetical protein
MRGLRWRVLCESGFMARAVRPEATRNATQVSFLAHFAVAEGPGGVVPGRRAAEKPREFRICFLTFRSRAVESVTLAAVQAMRPDDRAAEAVAGTLFEK